MFFKAAPPYLCVALINSHLHQRDEARAGATSWLEPPSVAHRKRECSAFLNVKPLWLEKQRRTTPVHVAFTVMAVATEEEEGLGQSRLGGESGIIDPGDMATIISHLIVD